MCCCPLLDLWHACADLQGFDCKPDGCVVWCCVCQHVGRVCCLCRLAPTSEWDTAAADIIVREAGGVVLQAGKVTGKGELLEDWQDVLVKELPLEYNKQDLLNPCFVVFGKRRL